MTEIKFTLERSEYYNNRLKLLSSNGIPKLSDAKVNLGVPLAKVVFEQCDEALKEDFGLKWPLKGPGDILWVSPSDLLIGKVALKPPFTPKCLQALTHKGILEIGLGLENKFREEMELDKQRTLEKFKAELLATVEDRMKAEIKDVEIRERLNCHMEMEKQQLEFELILKDELDKLEKRIREQYEIIITQHENVLKEKWEQQVEEEVKKTVDKLTQEFLKQLNEQEEKLTHVFYLELRKREILRDFDAKLHKCKMRDTLRQLKHNLECTNLVNMMYLLCIERKRCCEKKTEIENYYQNNINKLQMKIKQKDDKIQTLKREKENQIKEVHLRETCLLEVIKHFQKFINFALRAAPTQAEFLLSVQKMMVFELTNAVTQSEFPDAKENPPIIPWSNECKTHTRSTVSNLEIQDYHNCFNELNPPVPENAEMGEDGTLPAIYFKNKMYVREDFRDMLSAQIEIRPSNEIWNTDVELLIENWRKQSAEAVHTEPSETADLSDKSIENASNTIEVSVKNREEMMSVGYSCTDEKRRSKQSTVQFIETGGTRRKSVESKKLSRKSSLRPVSFPIIDVEQLQPVDPSMSVPAILGARDSLEVIIEQRTKSSTYMTTEENYETVTDDFSNITAEEVKFFPEEEESTKELVVETRDSVILRMSSIGKHQSSAEFTASPKDSIELAKCILDKSFEVKTKPSKLSAAKNSVELLRESIIKLREPAEMCQKKDQQQDHSVQVFGFAGTCCGRCKRKGEQLITSDTDVTKNGSKILKPDSFSDEKSVKISRIQVINLDEQVILPSVVSFHAKPEVYGSVSLTDTTVKKSTASSKSRKKVIKRKTNPCKTKVVGNPYATEGEQSSKEFTANRIHSLINLMKEQPQLMQLFTAGLR